MTDLEDRVRDALQARAGGFTTSPDAWERTRARAGDRAIRRQAYHPARRRWLTRFTPLAAAAAVLVIGVGLASLAAAGGSPAPRATPPTATSRGGSPAPQATRSIGGRRGGFPGMDCAFPGVSKKIPVSGVQISAKVTVNQVTIWWTRIPETKYPQAHTDLALCQFDAVHGGRSGPQAPLGRGQLVQASAPFSGLGGATSMSGIAAASVTSVEADLANGNVEHGSLAYGAGFPDAVWWLDYPQGIGATIVFRDAAGRVVKEIAEPFPPASALKHPVTIAPVPTGDTGWDAACKQARVQQVMGGIKVWTYIGFTVPRAVQPNHAKPTLCEVTGIVGAEPSYVGTYTMPAGQAARVFFALYPTSSVSGMVLPRATSVTAVLASGKEYSGTIVTNKLFTYPVWIVSYPLKDPATLVFRDAAGAQVAVLHVLANPQP